MQQEQYPEELRYSDNHLWVHFIENQGIAIIGISLHANEQIKNIMLVELPEPGAIVECSEEIGLLESRDSTFSLYTPLSGQIVCINNKLVSDPSLINTDPYGYGWLYKITLIDQNEIDSLMSAEEYQDFIEITVE